MRERRVRLGLVMMVSVVWMACGNEPGQAGTLAGVVLQAIVGLILHRLLSRPKTVEYLIETEAEMIKVHWPSWKDTRTGTVAVIVTVMVMLLFLMAVDYIFLESFKRLFTINLGG